MHVFVTGGTGALGRPVVRRLVAAGHRVRALARSEGAAQDLRRQGAEPVDADLFNPASVRQAVAGADAVLHLATRIPAAGAARKREAWRENDRIRREGTRNLVDAALASGVATFVYPSVTLVYPGSGDTWIDANTTAPQPPRDVLPSTLEAEAEVARFTAQGRRGVVLRMGQFYGPDRFSREVFKTARRGIGLVLGDADAYQSAIWIDDAAAAVVAALDARAPAGIYDVVDDEPLRRRDLLAAIALAAGRKRLRRIPAPVARMAGGVIAEISARGLRVSNQRFREASGWAPRVPSARDGWRLLAAEFAGGPEPGGARAVSVARQAKIGLAVLAAGSLPVGLWQLLAPRSFYDDFPGFGRHWVSPDGPFNEHLMRDVGSLTLALGVVAVVALLWTTAATVRAAAMGALVSSLPHFIYHLVHLDDLATRGDQIAQTAALAVAPLVSLVLLRLAGRLTAPGEQATRGHTHAAGVTTEAVGGR